MHADLTSTAALGWLMLIVKVVAAADCPLFGVKKYVVVAVLFIAGVQVPEIPFEEVDGKAGMLSPLQYDPTCVKSGATIELTPTPKYRKIDQFVVSAACQARTLQ